MDHRRRTIMKGSSQLFMLLAISLTSVVSLGQQKPPLGKWYVHSQREIETYGWLDQYLQNIPNFALVAKEHIYPTYGAASKDYTINTTDGHEIVCTMRLNTTGQGATFTSETPLVFRGDTVFTKVEPGAKRQAVQALLKPVFAETPSGAPEKDNLGNINFINVIGESRTLFPSAKVRITMDHTTQAEDTQNSESLEINYFECEDMNKEVDEDRDKVAWKTLTAIKEKMPYYMLKITPQEQRKLSQTDRRYQNGYVFPRGKIKVRDFIEAIQDDFKLVFLKHPLTHEADLRADETFERIGQPDLPGVQVDHEEKKDDMEEEEKKRPSRTSKKPKRDRYKIFTDWLDQ